MSDNPVLAALARLEAGQAKLEAGQAKLEAGQAKLEAGQSRLEAGLTNLEAGQTTLRVDVMARMDRLENKLNDIRDDMTVTMAHAGRAHDAVDSTRKELRSLHEEVTMMYRQIKKLEARVNEITDNP